MPDLLGLLPLVLVLLVFWLFVLRPARNRQRDLARVQGELAPGSRVMTSSGMYATVVALEGDVVRLEIATGVQVRYARQAVVRVLDEPATHPGDGPVARPEARPQSPPERNAGPGAGAGTTP